MVSLKRFRLLDFATAALLCVAVVLFNRCGTSPSDPAPPPAGSFAHVYSILQTANCNECHTPGGSASQSQVTLDFTSPSTAYTSLTTSTVSAQDATSCSGIKIVVAGNPSKSYLAAVLSSTYYSGGSNFSEKSGCTPYTAHQNLL